MSDEQTVQLCRRCISRRLSLTFPRRTNAARFLVGNPTEIRDWRDPQDRPNGAKPVTKKIEYDDLNRATRIDYSYAAGHDLRTNPFAAEVSGASNQQDPRRAQPSPHGSFDKRVLRQSFQYDWPGNSDQTSDDADGFYDRSLGTVENDTEGHHRAHSRALHPSLEASLLSLMLLERDEFFEPRFGSPSSRVGIQQGISRVQSPTRVRSRMRLRLPHRLRRLSGSR